VRRGSLLLEPERCSRGAELGSKDVRSHSGWWQENALFKRWIWTETLGEGVLRVSDCLRLGPNMATTRTLDAAGPTGMGVDNLKSCTT